MSQTTGAQCLAPSITFLEGNYSYRYLQVQQDLAIVGMLGGLYGVLFVLSVLSLRALTQGRRKTQPISIVLCLTILALFTSTTVYIITSTLSYQSTLLQQMIAASSDLWDYSVFLEFPDEPREAVKDYSQLQACASTATLTINVVLGDAIVCWRACTVWQKNRVVKAICGMFLLATFIVGAVGTNQGCHSPYLTSADSNSDAMIWVGSMFQGVPIGIAACVLSLSTNLLATLLVAYKAWQSRRRLRGYFVAKVGGSQVEKLLVLLVESGAVYCAIWSVVVAFQICEYNWWTSTDSISTNNARFLNVGGVLLNGTLVPGIAIYPAFIIALVALNRSHIEKGFTLHLESLPTPHIAFTLTTSPISPREHRSAHRNSDSEELIIGGKALGDSDPCARDSEDMSEHGSKGSEAELRVDGVICSRVPLDA